MLPDMCSQNIDRDKNMFSIFVSDPFGISLAELPTSQYKTEHTVFSCTEKDGF